VPDEVALRLTRTKALGSALDLFDLAEETGMALESAARTYFELGEKLRMPWMLGAIVQLSVTNQWQALARSKLRDDAYRLHRLLAGHVIRAGGVDAWSAANERRLKFSLSRLAELQASGPIDYAGLAVAVRELYALQLG
jgi:glutamate dehydrogenase